MNSRRTLLIELDRVASLRRDGPALRLALRGRSEQWFPLRRLSRILCSGDPAPHFATLLWCSGQGIPVSFLAASGRLVAQLLHPGGQPSPLHHWLEAKDCDPDLQQAWQDWHDNLQAHWYAELGLPNSAPALRQRRLSVLTGQLASRLGLRKRLHEHRPALHTLARSATEDALLARRLSLFSQPVHQVVDALEQPLVNLAQLKLLEYWKEHDATGSPAANLVHAWRTWGMDLRIERALRLLERQLEHIALFQDCPLEAHQP
ncbi:CRISPR-associated endonuclease Cas1 [Azotobacter vinelandii]|uniref:CRISPR-associated endonuclease Cas1 n=1 Tax=Azotobacter vinelandii TaxID=354 RepID=UPI002665479C|nr:CRISPR-associated endonuclease Cas1 [Azotobacter vinelandii]WKN24005.1 CRISPR-associated endonuclease Cas1 [Azotobacter vinelandii]